MTIRERLPVIALALIASVAHAQTVGSNKDASKSDTLTLSVRSQLVVEAVTVKDKQGSPVQNLGNSDFTLTEAARSMCFEILPPTATGC